MDRSEEAMKDQMQALLRVISITQRYRDDNVPSEIEEGIYLGSIGAANNKDVLKSLNVTHVLTVARYIRSAHPNDFIHKDIPVVDTEDTNLSQYFDECIDFIDEAKKQGGGVLVHCFAGKSRSATVVVAYLMRKHGMTLSEALKHVKIKRAVANPNAGFVKQLQDLEKSLQGKQEAV